VHHKKGFCVVVFYSVKYFYKPVSCALRHCCPLRVFQIFNEIKSIKAQKSKAAGAAKEYSGLS